MGHSQGTGQVVRPDADEHRGRFPHAGDGAASAGFNEIDLAMLQLLADQAGVAVQRYSLQQAALESVSLRREMELARGVQEAMIPKGKPDVPGLEAAGWTRPASINGGDFFSVDIDAL